MKKLITMSLLTTIMVIFLTGQAIAAKPPRTINPNGFPRGEHFNLNILGKKSTFTCPEQEYYSIVTTCVHPDGVGGFLHLDKLVKDCPAEDDCELTDIEIYGKVIFVPEDTQEDVRILMQSGKKGGGGRNKELPVDTLQVLDPCAGFDGPGDTALLQLPSNVDSYDVYARPLATPQETPGMTVTPGLFAAEDEFGNALYYLGQVNPDGVFTLDEKEFVRQKGKSVAVDITDLFRWTGTVCYLSEDDVPGGNPISSPQVCAVDDAVPPDGYDGYDWYYPAVYDEDNQEYTCPNGGVLETVYCHAYTDAWIFSIADFVTYLWGLDNDGLRHLQVRFYPVGKETETAPPRRNTLATQWGNIKSK